MTRRSDQAELQAEVLALRRQVQVLERHITRFENLAQIPSRSSEAIWRSCRPADEIGPRHQGIASRSLAAMGELSRRDMVKKLVDLGHALPLPKHTGPCDLPT